MKISEDMKVATFLYTISKELPEKMTIQILSYAAKTARNVLGNDIVETLIAFDLDTGSPNTTSVSNEELYISLLIIYKYWKGNAIHFLNEWNGISTFPIPREREINIPSFLNKKH